jgi:hypothetical protein
MSTDFDLTGKVAIVTGVTVALVMALLMGWHPVRIVVAARDPARNARTLHPRGLASRPSVSHRRAR